MKSHFRPFAALRLCASCFFRGSFPFTAGALVVAALLLGVGCRAPEPGDSPRDRGGAKTRKAAPAGRPGRVEGIVRYEGELPPPLPVNLTGPHAAVCDSAKGVYEMSVVRGPGGGLANAFVSVEGVPEGEPRPPQTRTIAIDGCVIKPYVIDGTAGDSLEIRNEDDHVYLCALGSGPDLAFRQGVLPDRSSTFALDRPGGRRIDCTQDHPWLKGHALVARHPYHAVTTASGRFAIDGVPPGRYTVQAWHPTQRQASAEVTVPPGGVGRVEVVYRSRVAARPDGGPPAAPSKTAAPAAP